jgi:hypothetical protein
MCRRYTTKFHTKCEDERADPPERKDSANFCEYYKPRAGAFDAYGKMEGDAASAQLKALFGQSGGETDEEDAPGAPAAADDPLSAAESLFKKD